MKKSLVCVLLAGLLLVSSGCRKQPALPASSSPAASSPAGSASVEQTSPAPIEELAVELPRTVDVSAARAAMKQLPQEMKEIPVERVSLSFGSSGAATAEAVEAGGVAVAFLTAADYVEFCGTAQAVLADAYPALTLDDTDPSAAWNETDPQETDELTAGTFALICTAPTEYGKRLAELSAQRGLTWQELDHARWGVLAEDSLVGRQCAELWLQDRYEDNGIADLSHVAVYDSWESLLKAAAKGEVDCFPMSPALRVTHAAIWTLETNRTADGGQRGFGRALPLRQELQVIGVTERLYRCVAAVTAEDEAVNQPMFAADLAQALNDCCDGPAERQAALGASAFAPIEPSALNGMRRLQFGK